MLTPFELRRVGERSAGLVEGSLAWTGPFDPQRDDDWRDMQSGHITERDYWARQVDRFGELTGQVATMPEMMAHLYGGPEEELIRPQALTLMDDAQAAGIPVGVLTNDLTAFHDEEWVARMSVLTRIDALVDGRRDGVLKPDPAAYFLMCQRLNVTPENAVFVDDQPINLEGGRAVGMMCVHLDPTDPAPGFAEARRLLGLEFGA